MASPNALPRYVQISEMLIRDIAAGRLLEGERLPPERAMASSLGISVGTLRKALSDLEERSLLTRVQGSGNYIRSGPEATGIYALFRLEKADGGGLPTAQILSVDKLEKPADAPSFGTGRSAHRIRRLRRLDGDPAAVEEIWLDGRFAGKIAASDLSESLYHTYRTRYGLLITRAEDRVGLDTVPDWTPGSFPLSPGTPCGFVERLSRAQDGAPAEYSRTWFDPQTTRYVARLR
jgi:GntR family transcriptional regulator